MRTSRHVRGSRWLFSAAASDRVGRVMSRDTGRGKIGEMRRSAGRAEAVTDPLRYPRDEGNACPGTVPCRLP